MADLREALEQIASLAAAHARLATPPALDRALEMIGAQARVALAAPPAPSEAEGEVPREVERALNAAVAAAIDYGATVPWSTAEAKMLTASDEADKALRAAIGTALSTARAAGREQGRREGREEAVPAELDDARAVIWGLYGARNLDGSLTIRAADPACRALRAFCDRALSAPSPQPEPVPTPEPCARCEGRGWIAYSDDSGCGEPCAACAGKEP